MADSDREDLISQFRDVTGTTAERATFYLESANWTLQLALASFFEQDDNNEFVEPSMINDDDDDQATADISSIPFLPIRADSSPPIKVVNVDKGQKQSKSAAPAPRIATIHNMAKDSSDDEEEQGQAFYTGTNRSGQQILGPPKKNPIKDYVSEVFRSAQESGAEVVEQAHSSSGPSVFAGTGYRLGQTNDDHETLPDPSSRPNRPQNIEPVILKLWRQGFSINDGDLRPYEEQSNKDFLECIMKGEIPQELRQKGGSMVHVDLEDHRHEEFSKTGPKVKAFAGIGHTLGSPAPTVVENNTVPTAPETIAQNEKQATDQLNIDVAQPTTMIQVRLADSSRLSARFNHSHTIGDIRNYITTARPQYAGQNFALLTTFPSRELTDEAQNIAAAGLLNAAIMQRLK